MTDAIVTAAGAYTGRKVSRRGMGDTLPHAIHNALSAISSELGEPVVTHSISTPESINADLQTERTELLRGVH